MTLNLKKFHRLCNAAWIGRQVDLFPSIGSTNTYLHELVASGAPASGTVAFTDFQSAGRGRLDRRWVAPANSSLLVSVLFRPKFPTANATWLTMISGLAAIEAVNRCTDLSLKLKWPNDLMLQADDGSWRKTGGILLEAELSGDRIEYAIIGMGLNVNIAQEDLPEAVTPATSLLVEGGEMVDREALLAAWVDALEKLVDSAELGRSPQPAWNDQLITLNQAVTVSGAQSLSGTAVGTNDFGQLLVQDASGAVHAVTAGDVTLRPTT